MGVNILFISIVLQFAAAGLALSLIRRTGYRLAWGAVATALALMGLRRAITFWKVISDQDSRILDPTAESVALVISGLMLAGVILISRMFAEERTKSQSLESARKLLQQTIDAAPTVISIKGADYRYVFVNRYMADRHGMEPWEFKGKTVAEALSGIGDRALVEGTNENDARVISTGEAIPVFEEIVTIKGDARHMLTSKTPLFGEDGRVQYVLTVALDVTQRKMAEQALHDSEEKRELAVERLRNAIASMDDGFVLYDAEGKLEFFNESFRKFNRYDASDLNPGVTTYTELGKLDKKHAAVDYRPATFEQRMAQLRGYGSAMIIQEVGDRVYERRQSVTPEGGIIGITKDVTEQKIAETAMIYSREQAEKASAAKSEFLAAMSHELRTPMNAILGFTQILKLDAEKTLTATQMEYLNDVLRGGNHLLALINEILDLAKIEANEIQLAIGSVNVTQVVADCLSLLEPMREGRGIVIANRLADHGTVMLEADEMRLKQILLNLVSNALRFNKERGTVSISGAFTSAGRFRVDVTDTGHGIPDCEHENVFSMFHQIGGNPQITTEGTGIGLYVSKLLTEKMHGRIGFESAEGAGSTFWIELPAAGRSPRT